ncbi:hypothetical protein F511_21151 [Dorcoceras hygrometricum]|uniref:DUF1985 domain-containing protein n=1 Tax=Dorcoceras hygrometricum TaxID=472368 RepID=A0A2Z7A9C5_9LAMI|nr:hypothetical protein F511_21151 [Dorcoceras hygrometricum]
MVKRKAIEAVDMELQERTFGTNHVIYYPTKLEKEQVFDCKITLGSQYHEVCERILSFLNERELQRMVQDGQFGNLIRYASDYLNSNQLLWFLTSRQAVDCGTEFWMVIHKRSLRFSLLEYGLITGLNCSSTYPAIPEEDGFHRSHFPGMSTVTLVDLRQAVDCGTEFWMVIHKRSLRFSLLEYGLITGLNCSSTYPAIPEEDGFHRSHFPGMSTVTLVDLSIGPRRKRKKEVVDPHWMRLVDDMDSFNTYPWGRLAYEEVLFGLRKDLRARFEEVTNLAKKRKRDPNFSGFGSLHLSGFVQPLRILAYEVYNGVAEAFATRREDADVSLPRMCHWMTRKWHKNHAPSLSDVVAAFISSQCEVSMHMKFK